MGSLLEELARRQVEARQRIEQLRGELAELEACLETEEERLSRLVITQETVEEILGEAAVPAAQPAAQPAAGQTPAGVDNGQGRQAEVVRRGVVLVPPWQPGVEISALPQAYQDVLEVLADAGEAMRAGKISAALGRGESAAAVEGLRGKLRRLAERGWLTQEVPGMFALTEQVKGQIVR